MTTPSPSFARPRRKSAAPSVLPLIAPSLLLFFCSLAIGRVPAAFLGAAQGLLIIAQALLIVAVVRLRCSR